MYLEIFTIILKTTNLNLYQNYTLKVSEMLTDEKKYSSLTMSCCNHMHSSKAF